MTSAKTDRLMTLAELANYLHMGRNTVLKLVDAKKIPGLHIENEWRFRKSDIDTWLSNQLESDADDFESVIDGMHLPLGDIMPQSAIIHDMRATDALSAIEELAARAYNEKWLNDKPWFIGSLVERETLASTAMEGGVAFLHTRARESSKIKRPFVVCGRSYNGIDFGAPDGKPTFLFFLLGLKYDKLHLPILGRLARLVVRDPTFVARLRATTSPVKMRANLLKLDAEELSTTRVPKVATRAAAPPAFDPKARLRQIMKLNARRQYEQKKQEDAEAKAKKKEEQRLKREAAKLEKAEATKIARAVKKAATEAKKADTKKTTETKTVKKRAATTKPAAKTTKVKPITSKKTPTTKKSTATKATTKKSATAKKKA